MSLPPEVRQAQEIVDGFLVQVSRLERLNTPHESGAWTDAMVSLMESLQSICVEADE